MSKEFDEKVARVCLDTKERRKVNLPRRILTAMVVSGV